MYVQAKEKRIVKPLRKYRFAMILLLLRESCFPCFLWKFYCIANIIMVKYQKFNLLLSSNFFFPYKSFRQKCPMFWTHYPSSFYLILSANKMLPKISEAELCQTRKRPQRILCVLSRSLTKYGAIWPGRMEAFYWRIV